METLVESMVSGATIGAVVATVMFVGSYFYTLKVDARKFLARKTEWSSELTSPLTLEQTFLRLSNFQHGKIKVVHADEVAKTVVVDFPMDFCTFGLFFVVKAYIGQYQHTKVSVECHPKIFQRGPLVTRRHHRVLKMLEEHLQGAAGSGASA